jgi:AraC family transcriptional regulator, melibiose operon regulatory protein
MHRAPLPVPALTHFGLECRQDPVTIMTGDHRHNEVEFNFVERGAMCYRFGANRVVVEEGHLALFWAAMPHRVIEVADATKQYWLTIPLALFLRWQLPPALASAVLDGEIVRAHDLPNAERDRLLFEQWARDLAAPTDDAQRVVVLELEARLRRMAQVIEAQPPAAQPDAAHVVHGRRRKAEQLAQFIAEHYAEDVRVEQIARAAHLHPNYAMRVFREAYGLRLMDYVVQHRVAQAQRLLVTTDRSPLDIAYAVGFGSASRFYAAFKDVCGQAPGAYRASLGIVNRT